jgi:hypothetical protein
VELNWIDDSIDGKEQYMSTLVIAGMQWGSEGKSKVVDLLARNAVTPRSSAKRQ